MTTSTLDSPLVSTTSQEDHIDGKFCRVNVITARNLPPRIVDAPAAYTPNPSRRYASWTTSPLGPLLAVFFSLVAFVVFVTSANISGVLVSIVFVIAFLGLALFNLVTPDSSDRT